MAADDAAVTGIRNVLVDSGQAFRVVSGEGLLDNAPRLDQGERIGSPSTGFWDMAVDPLDGTTLCAKGLPGAICALGIGEAGAVLPAPDMYMWKLMAGPDCPAEAVHPQAKARDVLRQLAESRKVSVSSLTVSMLKRRRHAALEDEVRSTGANVRLLAHGDLMPALWVCTPGSGVDLHLGTGGAPEGVVSAMILKAMGGQMAARLLPQSETEREAMKSSDLTGWPVEALCLNEIVRSHTVVAIASVTGTPSLAPVTQAGGGLRVEAETWSSLANAEERLLRHSVDQDATED